MTSTTITRCTHDRATGVGNHRPVVHCLEARPGRLLRRTLLASLSVLGAWAGPALASCWEAAGARYAVNPWLLAAIAKVESNFDPRAVNSSHAIRTGSVDLGLMQINSRWLPVLARHGITREQLLDPCTSTSVGAWILAGLFHRYGMTWEAVGAYNAACVRVEASECALRRSRYVDRIRAALQELSSAHLVPVATRTSAAEDRVRADRILQVRFDQPSIPRATAAMPILIEAGR